MRAGMCMTFVQTLNSSMNVSFFVGDHEPVFNVVQIQIEREKTF